MSRLVEPQMFQSKDAMKVLSISGLVVPSSDAERVGCQLLRLAPV